MRIAWSLILAKPNNSNFRNSLVPLTNHFCQSLQSIMRSRAKMYELHPYSVKALHMLLSHRRKVINFLCENNCALCCEFILQNFGCVWTHLHTHRHAVLPILGKIFTKVKCVHCGRILTLCLFLVFFSPPFLI